MRADTTHAACCQKCLLPSVCTPEAAKEVLARGGWGGGAISNSALSIPVSVGRRAAPTSHPAYSADRPPIFPLPLLHACAAAHACARHACATLPSRVSPPHARARTASYKEGKYCRARASPPAATPPTAPAMAAAFGPRTDRNSAAVTKPAAGGSEGWRSSGQRAAVTAGSSHSGRSACDSADRLCARCPHHDAKLQRIAGMLAMRACQ